MKTSMPLLALTALLVSTLLATAADAPATPKVGDPAPKVEGIDQNGKPWKLADHLGKQAVLLYFYPKDNTPGCTTQACGLRDRMGDLRKSGVEVVGISFDSPESHRKFIADHNLNFPLIADTDGKIADAYNARKAPNGKMSRRVSFLIGKDGRIAHVTDTPAAANHLAEMKEAVAKLPSR